jgi:N-acetylgalactosamine kinase
LKPSISHNQHLHQKNPNSGRVNLIGEHIDYEGYGVLPMAIANDTVVAVRRTADGTTLAVANVNAAEYPAATFSTDPAQPVDTANHSWANYFLAAYKGVFEHLGAAAPAPAGLQVMVHGTVPLGRGLRVFVCCFLFWPADARESPLSHTRLFAQTNKPTHDQKKPTNKQNKGSGLSSSAAIVVASSLAVLAAHGLSASKAAVAEFTCTAERHVGVTSGGMDQVRGSSSWCVTHQRA